MMKWLALLLAAVVIAACFFPWVIVETKNITIGGFYSDVPDFGKPGLFHLILCSIYIVLILIGKVWSLRTAFFVSAFNIAWAVRNFILISACRGGVCPDKQTALYLVLACSVLTTIVLLFAGMDKKNEVGT